MIFYFFYKGLLTGATIAAIGGPVGILCIRRSITEGLLAGVAIGFGAALADALFGSIAGFGLTFVSNFLLQHQKIISLIGGLFLLYLGIVTFVEPVHITSQNIPTMKKEGIFKYLVASFFITLTNPATILFFTAISVSLGVGLNTYLSSIFMVSGIFVGSLLWFTLLALVVSTFRANITLQRLTLLNKIFGLGLIIFGCYVAIKALC